jgi:TolB protein
MSSENTHIIPALAKFIQPLIFFALALLAGCDLLNNDNKGRCTIFCEDFQFMHIDKEPSWSPDGETIAFIRGSTEPGKHGIYLIGPDGENLRQVHAGVAGSPSWSPDGEWIAFHENAQIYKKHIETDSLVQLTNQGRNFHPAWSPDGEWIAFNMSICDGPDTCGIWLMSSNGTQKRNLSNFGNFPDWHPNNGNVAFIRKRVDEGYTTGNEFWESEADSESGRELLIIFLSDEYHFDTRYLKYSPDGQRMVFTSQPRSAQSGFAYPQIWTMDLEDSYRKQLTENGGWAADWSPDGDWIVYTETYETGRLWLMRPDGSEKQQLTFE